MYLLWHVCLCFNKIMLLLEFSLRDKSSFSWFYYVVQLLRVERSKHGKTNRKTTKKEVIHGGDDETRLVCFSSRPAAVPEPRRQKTLLSRPQCVRAQMARLIKHPERLTEPLRLCSRSPPDRPPAPVNVSVTHLRSDSATVSWEVPEGDIIIGFSILQQVRSLPPVSPQGQSSVWEIGKWKESSLADFLNSLSRRSRLNEGMLRYCR